MDTTTILTTIRTKEAEEGAQYNPLDWMYDFSQKGVPKDDILEALFVRLGESARDAGEFLSAPRGALPGRVTLTMPQYMRGLEACAVTVPQRFLHHAEAIADQFGRFLRPDIMERTHGEGHEPRVKAGMQAMHDAFRKAAARITAITSCWDMAHLDMLPIEELVEIGMRIPMSPFGVAFAARVALMCKPNEKRAYELLARVTDAIRNAPMEPEVNAAVLYRFAIMGGVRLNCTGVPDWTPDNRFGQVPKAWFNRMLTHAVIEAGWRFANPEYRSGPRQRPDMWEVTVVEERVRTFYVHNVECWRNERLERDTRCGVMVPAFPHPSMTREGEGEYGSVVIGFHPVAVPTIELIRRVGELTRTAHAA